MSTDPGSPMRLLVPLDGSLLAGQALAYAAALARPGDEIHLLHVAPCPEPPRDERGVRGTLADAFRAVGSATAGVDVIEPQLTDEDLRRCQREAHRVVEDAADLWKDVISEPRQHVAFGDPAEHIRQAAAEIGADLIVMGSHGRGALGRWRYGSVADRVVRSATVPVLIVRPEDGDESFGVGPVHRFVVALDGSPVSAQALPLARALAARLRKPLHLISVVPTGLRHTAYLESTESAAADAEKLLEGLATELRADGVAATWSVESGEAFRQLTEAVKQGDVLVLASHGRSGLRRWVLGSVAEKLIRMADVPTLVVRANPAPVEA